MIKGSKKGEDGKKEDANDSKISTKPSSSTSSSWLRLKDPRIVRVSRAFGGKDRHSKVCTVRGLRDRRVRLSVPTAIQLYDLQDRLGLNQPSKVVDWLLNVAKDEIDELPPLPMPPLSFSRNLLPNNTHPQVAAARAVTSSQNGDWDNENNEPRSGFLNSSPHDARGKSKEVKADQKENSQYNNCSSLADFLNNPQAMPPQGSLYQWEANSNFPVPYISRFEDGHYNMSLPSTLMSLSSSYFPAASVHIPAGIDSRQMNQFQMLSSGASLVPNSTLYQPMRPFQLSMSTPQPPVHSQNEQNKEQDLHQFPSE